MSPLAALALAAQLMHQPVPQDIQVMWMDREPTRSECPARYDHCWAMTALAGKIWIIIAPKTVEDRILVHEACHAIQTVREGHAIKGRVAENECWAVSRAMDLASR